MHIIMKIPARLFLLTLLFVAATGAKPASSANFASMLKDRAVVVLCDKASGKVLDAHSFAATNLVGSFIYTNGPSVNVVCLGDLVNPQIRKEQISGPKVTVMCRDDKIAGIIGQTITFHFAPDSKFLQEVQTILAKKQLRRGK